MATVTNPKLATYKPYNRAKQKTANINNKMLFYITLYKPFILLK